MRSLRVFAFIFGIGFIFAGISGFIPALTPDGYLFSLFEVNSMHNIVHIASGVVALLAASKTSLARWYFIIFGFVYTAVAILGFANSGDVFGMHVNMADNFLHLFIGVVALFLGLTFKAKV